MASHSTGATTASEKFSARLLDRRAGDPGGIERCSIAADDMRYCAARCADILGFERSGDGRHMPMQAALREQRACGKSNDENTEWQPEQFALDDEGHQSGHDDDDQQRDDTG